MQKSQAVSASRNNLNPNLQASVRGNEKIFLFTNARDEPSICEWAFHHLILGFSHVFIYDHLSETPIQSLFDEYWLKHPDNSSSNSQALFRGRIHVIRIDKKEEGNNQKQSRNIKIPLMNAALKYCIDERADWLLYLDADEFLTINNHTFKEENPVKQLLTLFYFADTLAINWLMFGSSNHETQPQGLIMNNFTHSDDKLNPHVKTFVRPAFVSQAINPHYYPAIHPSRSFAATGNAVESMSAFNLVDIEFRNAPAYVAHYVVQSKQEFLRRKGREMDDGTGDKSNMYAADQLHVVHNNYPNDQMAKRHGEELDKLFS